VVVDDARADACRALLEDFAGEGGRVFDLGAGRGYQVGTAPELD
jgi:hypothetical protein